MSTAETDAQPSAKTTFTDLTGFQRDILWCLTHEDNRKGLSVKSELENYYSEEINHGRLYQNLDRLAERGLVEKSSRDLRTNEYSLTESAREALAARRAWMGGDDE